MRRYLPSSAINGPVSAWGLYKSDDDQTHSDDLCCLGGGRGGNLAWGIPCACQAVAQGYSQPSGPLYSAAPAPYPPGGYVVDERRGPGAPDFDALDDDDDAPNAQSSTALSPPGPVLSPADPRYGRPDSRPVYSDRAPRSDPVAGRSALRPSRWTAAGRSIRTAPGRSCRRTIRIRIAAPPIYSDRAPSLRPPGGIDEPRGLRPPRRHRRPAARRRARPQGADGRPIVLSALPPEEQPEVGPAQLPPHLRKQEVAYVTKEPAGTLVVDTPNTHLYYILGNGRAIRYGVRVGRDGFTWNGVQKVTRKAEWPDWHPPTEMIERQPYLPRFMAGGPGNPMGARAMYLGSTVSIASTAPTSPRPSASSSPRAASAC